MRIALKLSFLLLTLSAESLSQQAQIIRQSGATAVILRSQNVTLSRIPVIPSRIENGTTKVGDSLTKGTTLFDWRLKFSRGGKVFKDVSFSDPQTGYLVTELGAVYKTTDGGETWISKLDLGFPYYWYGVQAITPDTVIIAGFNNQAAINQGVVRWSYDGGDTWGDDISLSIPNGVGWLDRVHFFDRNTGIVMASFSGGAHYTSTGGKDSSSWSYVQVNSDLGWFAGNIDAQTSGNVFATGIHFAHSSDFGVSWTSMPSADNVFDGGVDFLDENNVLGWTGGGEISPSVEGWVHGTTDGGVMWSPRLFSFPYPIRVVSFFNDTLGFVAGGNVFSDIGGIYVTTDGGITWNLDLNSGAEMFSIATIRVSDDSVDTWCAGSTGGGSGFTGRLYKARMYMPSGTTAVTGSTHDEPTEFSLLPNYPNPFNPTTVISYRLSAVSRVSLKVYDLVGREIATLVDGRQEAGNWRQEWRADGVASGVYLYRLEARQFNGGATFIDSRKMVLVK